MPDEDGMDGDEEEDDDLEEDVDDYEREEVVKPVQSQKGRRRESAVEKNVSVGALAQNLRQEGRSQIREKGSLLGNGGRLFTCGGLSLSVYRDVRPSLVAAELPEQNSR